MDRVPRRPQSAAPGLRSAPEELEGEEQRGRERIRRRRKKKKKKKKKKKSGKTRRTKKKLAPRPQSVPPGGRRRQMRERPETANSTRTRPTTAIATRKDIFAPMSDGGRMALRVALSHLQRVRAGDASNSRMARQWLKVASDQGSARAAFQLGCMADGDAETAEWFELSAARGFAKAQCGLAELLLQRTGDDDRGRRPTFRDDCRAVELLESSAAQGYAQAQFVLGKLLYPKEKRKGQAVSKLETVRTTSMTGGLVPLSLIHI